MSKFTSCCISSLSLFLPSVKIETHRYTVLRMHIQEMESPSLRGVVSTFFPSQGSWFMYGEQPDLHSQNSKGTTWGGISLPPFQLSTYFLFTFLVLREGWGRGSMRTLTRCRTRFRGYYIPVLPLSVANHLSAAGRVEVILKAGLFLQQRTLEGAFGGRRTIPGYKGSEGVLWMRWRKQNPVATERILSEE